MRQYYPVDLYFQPIAQAQYSVTLIAPGNRSATGAITLPTAEPEHQRLAQQLTQGTISSTDLFRFGRKLYGDLFPDELGRALGAARERLQSHESIRLRLHINTDTSGDLASIPWEFLIAPSDKLPIALQDVPIVRCVRQTSRPVQMLQTPLKILLTAAVDVPPALDSQRELQLIERALEPMRSRIELTVDPRLSPGRLETYLRSDFNIWHFIGHGGIDPATGMGFLRLQDGQGDPISVSAVTLGSIIVPSQLSLIVLDACQSGSVARDPLWSLAPLLVQSAAPTVVAMQMPVSEESARIFAETFYQSLGFGQFVEVSVNAGRRKLVAQTRSLNLDWGIPVVYSPETLDSPAVQQEASRGLDALHQLMSEPAQAEVIRSMIGSRSIITLFREQLARLSHVKLAHDILHELQDEYDLMAGSLPELASDVRAWMRLTSGEARVYRQIQRLLDLLAHAETLRPFERRLSVFATIRISLRAGVEARDSTQVDMTLSQLRSALEREPPRLNQSLVERARELPIDQLVSQLATIERHRALVALSSDGAEQFRRFLGGLGALSETSKRLRTFVEQHDRFQELDIELHRLDFDADEQQFFLSLQRAWNGTLRLLTLALTETPMGWVDELRRDITAIDEALQSNSARRTIDHYLRYRTLIANEFNRIDHDIRTICESLMKLGGGIDLLLERMTR